MKHTPRTSRPLGATGTAHAPQIPGVSSAPSATGPSPAGLTRRDILAFEDMLRADVAGVLPFAAHALYFPMTDEVPAPVWIAEEEKLLLPLRREGALLGVLLLRRPDPEAVSALLPYLPGVAELCLAKLALHKKARTDDLTGLAARPVLMEELAREMERVRAAFASGPGPVPGEGPENGGNGPQDDASSAISARTEAPGHAGLSVTVLRFAGLRGVARGHGRHTAERLMSALGAALRAILPEEALAARTGDSEFAVLLPGGSRRSTHEAASAWVRALRAVRLASPLTGLPVHGEVFAGYALFPRDWEAAREGREPGEREGEAASLFDKARLAAWRAGQTSAGPPLAPLFQEDDDGVLGYGSILPRGGIIDGILPLSRVRVTLGRDVGAREGQRFSVWSLEYPVPPASVAGADVRPEPLYKGEIVLADVREDASQADILILGDPSWPLAPGDRLTLLPDDYGAAAADVQPSRPDPLTGLHRHGDFLARLAEMPQAPFGLALIRFDFPLASPGAISTEHAMAEAVTALRDLLAGRADVDGALLAGRYSLNSLWLYHPGLTPAAAKEIYEPLSSALSARIGVGSAMGVACLPWLSYRAADAPECCRKALEYALLLPEPHVGVFDSLAINISADKRYSQGDPFGAMEEYRLALLADEDNTLAWNSLGVCLAGVGRHAEALRALEEAVRRSPDDPAGHYNLGTIRAALGEPAEAAAHFQDCLTRDPAHLFARIRLGELAEARQDGEAARRFYEEALAASPGSPLPHHCLARLDMREERPDKARERLHLALRNNPQDAGCLHLLARLYLDGGEDPEMAETLARQSVALRPDRRAHWLELARALDAQGRHREAREARVNAGER